MLPVISVQNMRDSDAYTIANHIPSLTLMYRAAMGIYDSVSWHGSIAILTSSGNNAGDGYALACILADRGIASTVIRVSEKNSHDGDYYYQMALSKLVKIRQYEAGENLNSYDIIVDCLLGTGFSDSVRENYAAAIDAVNRSGAYVVSVDINSGLNGDTGLAEIAVRSDLTVTIGFLKTGFFRADAARYLNDVTVVDIGIKLLRQEYHCSTVEETAEGIIGDFTAKDIPGKIHAISELFEV